MRGAIFQSLRLRPLRPVSIRAPLAGRDDGAIMQKPVRYEFQSARPLRGAIRWLPTSGSSRTSFNPRAPCGARFVEFHELAFQILFQSARPLRGAIVFPLDYKLTITQFQSARPLRGAMKYPRTSEWDSFVSIRAPLAGRDPSGIRPSLFWSGFNPRAPCGARCQRDQGEQG